MNPEEEDRPPPFPTLDPTQFPVAIPAPKPQPQPTPTPPVPQTPKNPCTPCGTSISRNIGNDSTGQTVHQKLDR